jgi:putative glutamine amidotransferase
MKNVKGTLKKTALHLLILLIVVVVLVIVLGGAWTLKIKRDAALLPAPIACTLPPEARLLVSCTDACGFFNTRAVQRAASRLGYPIDIIPDLSTQPAGTLAKLDALIIPGGADIAPSYYTPHLPPGLKARIQALDDHMVYSREGKRRDAYEFELLQRYFADESLNHLPILGICRGMQMLSVSQGIPLYIDINAELGMRTPKYHIDRVAPNVAPSEIQQLAQGKHFLASQIHHQAMRYDYYLTHQNAYPQLRVTALSHQSRIPEVLEFTERPVMGTQFHPEYTIGPIRGQIFEWLLGKACQKRQWETTQPR